MNTSDLITKLRENGVKVTPQRLAIFEMILSRKDHPTVEEIHESLHKEYPTISIATIYKTLQLMKQKGFIREVESTEGGIRYDPNTSLHLNLICTKCGRIQDETTQFLSQMWSQVISEIGIEPHGQNLNVFYVCDKCKKGKN